MGAAGTLLDRDGGLLDQQLLARTALLAPVTESSEPIPGFELLYTTPPAWRLLRLYQIRDDPAVRRLR